MARYFSNAARTWSGLSFASTCFSKRAHLAWSSGWASKSSSNWPMMSKEMRFLPSTNIGGLVEMEVLVFLKSWSSHTMHSSEIPLLHVWGANGAILALLPELLAATWLLSQLGVSHEIVLSNNTNISPTGVLPLLVDGSLRVCGYRAIAAHVLKGKGSRGAFAANLGSPRKELANLALEEYIRSALRPLFLYVFYVHSANYEKHTRKLFRRYLPFPMMYNQPLRFYHEAQEETTVVGLLAGNGGFFSLSGVETAQTESFNDEISDKEDTVAISGLHEQQLARKAKTKGALRESRNTMRCLHLMSAFVSKVEKLHTEMEGKGSLEKAASFGAIFVPLGLSLGELLLYAYLYLITCPELPDGFVAAHLGALHTNFLLVVQKRVRELNVALESASFRGPEGDEVPSLWNELRRATGMVKY